MEERNVIIIGSGPAGLTSAIYTARAGLKPLVLTGMEKGGQITLTDEIENFPGLEGAVSGYLLAQSMENQAQKFGAEFIQQKAVKVDFGSHPFHIWTDDHEYTGKAVIITTGSSPRRLNVPGEKELTGKGVSYCATCDGPFFKDKIVAVVGGSNAAVTTALYLANIAKKVYVIYRRDRLKAEKVWVDQLKKNKKIKVIYNTNVTKLEGDDVLKFAVLDKVYSNSKKLAIDGLFIEIGNVPRSAIVDDLNIKKDKNGFVEIDKNGRTNIPGVYACGDITKHPLKQIITAASQGAVAVKSVSEYLKKLQ